jgi:uncharacterized protein (DUF433 family)
VKDIAMSDTITLTLRETAFVFGDKFKNIIRIVDEHASSGLAEPKGFGKLRMLGMPDLIYIQALNEMGELLSPKGRLQLHEALIKARTHHEVLIGSLLLPIKQLQAKVEKRIEALGELKDRVEGDPDDPFIKGTRVQLYRVSALLDGGASVEEVLEDYPSLETGHVELARVYAEAIPKRGSPYPKTSFKRALGSMDIGALDEVLGLDLDE